MNVWMRMKRALTVMDHATRNWGRELRLDECGVMLLALLGEGGVTFERDLRMKCGRSRQQVYRSLLELKKRRLVLADNSIEGRNQAWVLTEKGHKLWRCLDRGISAFEQVLESRLDLPAITNELERVVQILLNRPGASGGWRSALCIPKELLVMPIGVEARMAGVHDSEEEPLPSTAPEPEHLEKPPGPWGPPEEWTEADREIIRLYWKIRAEKEDAAGRQQP